MTTSRQRQLLARIVPARLLLDRVYVRRAEIWLMPRYRMRTIALWLATAAATVIVIR